MDPITNPTGAYKGPPPGRRPDTCPQCGCVLEHFQAKTVAKGSSELVEGGPKPGNRPAPPASQQLVVPIDLFGATTERPQEGPQEPEKAPELLPRQRDIDACDIYVADEPAFGRTTEMQKSKMKDKAAKKAAKAENPTAPSYVKRVLHPNHDVLQVLDDPTIGGKVTICALLFGDFENLHRRCLTSILETVPPSRMDLRVATNQICLGTRNYLQHLPIDRIYDDTKTRKKYGAMRAMFHDPKNPINTEWLVWFDDDSYVRESNWLAKLGAAICEDKDPKLAMLGVKMLHVLRHPKKNKDPRKWFTNGTWWKRKQLRTRQGKEAPNGNCIHFVVGGFWALRTSAMLSCDIPDRRLYHNGGDICVGEQLHQNGFKTKLFNKDKKQIHTSAAPRRGFTEVFPWYR